MERDPICGMKVDEQQATATTTFKGTTYYFCSTGCKATFESKPKKYATAAQATHRDHV